MLSVFKVRHKRGCCPGPSWIPHVVTLVCVLPIVGHESAMPANCMLQDVMTETVQATVSFNSYIAVIIMYMHLFITLELPVFSRTRFERATPAPVPVEIYNSLSILKFQLNSAMLSLKFNMQ